MMQGEVWFEGGQICGVLWGKGVCVEVEGEVWFEGDG